MIVKLFDGLEIQASDKLREKVDAALGQSKSIIINGMTITPKSIAYIKNGGYTEADTGQKTNLLSPTDNRGEYSPAKEKLRQQFIHRKIKKPV